MDNSAQPESSPPWRFPFPDHHAYTEKDVRGFAGLREEKNCAAFVTTEKDVINLQPHAERMKPLLAAIVTMELLDPDAALSLLMAQIPARAAAV